MTLCACDDCTKERAGKPTLIRSQMFCAVCAHGYLDLRTGRPDDALMGCTRCGAVGRWVPITPAHLQGDKR